MELETLFLVVNMCKWKVSCSIAAVCAWFEFDLEMCMLDYRHTISHPRCVGLVVFSRLDECEGL